jgi:hypothetical protein
MARLNNPITQGIGAAQVLEDGLTGVESARQFVVVRTSGARDLVKRLEELSESASRTKLLREIVRKASQPIFDEYKRSAQEREATGNLAASVTRKFVEYPQGVACIVGPRQTGPVGDRPERRSGNHAWLVEFGTNRRKPGSQGRRTYINVHQNINRKFTQSGGFNNTEFENMSRGYYFLMGSKYEPSRQAGTGKPGYSRDFMLGKDGKSGEQHPITLRPGDTIAGMRRLGLMQKAIDSRGSECLGIMRNLLEQAIAVRGG